MRRGENVRLWILLAVFSTVAFASGSEKTAPLASTEQLAKIKTFLNTPLEYDRDWPPEIVSWKYERTGSYVHEFKRFFTPGFKDGLNMRVNPATMRAFVYGTKKPAAFKFQGHVPSWTGRAAAWRLEDSRALVAMAVFRTDFPAKDEASAPAASVALYSIDEDDRLLANLTVPMLSKETQLYIAKHYSLNKLQIKWVGTKRLRSFTIPDHTPLRLVLGIIGNKEGERIAGTIEIQPTQQAQEF